MLTWTQFSNSAALTAVMGSYPNPGTDGSKQFICSFSGGCLNPVTSELLIFGGGHNDYGGNEVLKFSLNQAVPAWSVLRTPTQGVGAGTSQTPVQGNAYYTDGTPSARHTYGMVQVVPELNRLMTFGAAAVWGNGNGNFDTIDGFNLSTNQWDPAGTWSGAAGLGTTICSTVRDFIGNIWHCGKPTGVLYRWNLADASITQFTSTGTPGGTINGGCTFVYDPKRHLIFRLPHSTTVAGYYDLSTSNAAFTQVTLNDPSGFLSDAFQYSAEYCPDRDTYVVLKAQSTSVYEVNPATFAVTALSVAGTPPAPALDGTGDFYGRFRYVPALRGFVLMAGAAVNVGFFRTG